MSTEKDMRRWHPCQSGCEMAGSACFFLSIDDSTIVINGPRWCSKLAESEMAIIEKKFERRFYCSEVKQTDLLYGAEDNLEATLEELRDEHTPALIGVLNSCAVSLIGDDLKGICAHAHMGCPIVPLDSGGLRGEFIIGWSRAACATLKTLPLHPHIPNGSPTVNIIGWCSAYPHEQGDLAEIKRLLAHIGVTVRVVYGGNHTDMDDLSHLTEASLNLVLHPELGLPVAAQLKQQLNQPYLICPIPYGLHKTKEWLMTIAHALHLTPDLTAIDEEIEEAREKIDIAIARLKTNNKLIRFGDMYAILTQGNALGLLPALEEDFPEPGRFFLRIEGPQEEIANEDGTETRKEYNTLALPEALTNCIPWSEEMTPTPKTGEIFLVLGNTNTRAEVAHYNQAVYVNLLSPEINLTVKEKPYAGIVGWKHFLADIFADFYTLSYANRRTNPLF